MDRERTPMRPARSRAPGGQRTIGEGTSQGRRARQRGLRGAAPSRPARVRGSQAVRRATHAAAPSIEDVGVDHRRLHVRVAEELLDRANVVAGIDQVSGEGMALMPGPALEALCRAPDYAGFKPSGRVILGISLE